MSYVMVDIEADRPTPGDTSMISLGAIPAHGARSLQWAGDHLVDWLRGIRWSLDGTSERFAPEADPSFDAATTCGSFAVVYERLGTRAQLLHEGTVLRELSRHDYHAKAFAYPICLWRTRAGRTLLAHCPESYRRIEIDDAHTGQRLTASDLRKPTDFFHSRLQVDPSGTRLLSAGWVWHPWDVVGYVELAAALEDPRQLDRFRCDVQPTDSYAEESAACWQNEHRFLVGSNPDTVEPEPEGAPPRLHPNSIAVYDVREGRVVSNAILGFTPGTMMPVGEDKAVTFHDHPRLVSLTSGAVLHEWPELPSGKQTSSIIWHHERPPILARDPARDRFAIVRDDEITIVSLELP